MKIFRYTALDDQGKKQKGVIEAQDQKEAKHKLRERRLMVSTLEERKKGNSKEALKGDNLLAFTVQLSQLVNAGIPIYESLVALEEQYQKENYHRVLESLCEQIKGGASLSDAMGAFPDSFDKMYRSMVAAGEAAGALGLVLERLSQFQTKQMKLKKEVSTALIYPAILASFCLLVIGLLLGFVVPSIEGIFEGRELNTFTSVVLSISHFAREKWWLYIPVIGGAIAYIIYQMRTAEGKIRMQRTFIKIPFIKNLIIESAVARFTRTMATLQRGGLPVINSMRMASEVMNNISIEEEMKRAELKIIEGSSLSAELKRSHYIPPIVSRMLAVGEDTGNTIVMLEKIADMYEESLEKTLTRLVALTQPAILIIMGGIIGAVMIAILLPLTEVASLTSG